VRSLLDSFVPTQDEHVPRAMGACFFNCDNDLRELLRLVPSVPTKNEREPEERMCDQRPYSLQILSQEEFVSDIKRAFRSPEPPLVVLRHA
jgi:hypothetical protein